MPMARSAGDQHVGRSRIEPECRSQIFKRQRLLVQWTEEIEVGNRRSQQLGAVTTAKMLKNWGRVGRWMKQGCVGHQIASVGVGS